MNWIEDFVKYGVSPKLMTHDCMRFGDERYVRRNERDFFELIMARICDWNLVRGILWEW